MRLYSENHLVAKLQMGEPLTAMRFGSYGREESALITVFRLVAQKRRRPRWRTAPGRPHPTVWWAWGRLRSPERRLSSVEARHHRSTSPSPAPAARPSPAFDHQVGASGALTIKFIQRTADLDVSSHPPGPPPEQDVPLSIPKKTKLYVEQTQREREQATEMHRVFQRDLCKLRLNTARAYVKIISDGQGPMSFSSGSGGTAALRLTAQVQGLGPRFKLKLNLQNTGTKAVCDMAVTFAYNAMLYRLKSSLVHVPLLVPGLLYRLDAELDCIDEAGGADAIRVFVCSTKSVLPVLSAVVNMPVSEVLLQ